MARLSFRSHRLRAFLASLGIVIGVTAVIAVISIGEGNKKKITDEIDKIGGDIFWIIPASSKTGMHTLDKHSSRFDRAYIQENDLHALMKHCDDIEALAAVSISNKRYAFGENTTNAMIVGTESSYLKVMDLKLHWGRFLSTFDLKNRTNVCVIEYEANVFHSLRKKNGRIFSKLYIDGYPFTIVGAVRKKTNWLRNPIGHVYVPRTSAMKLLGLRKITGVYCQVGRERMPKAMSHSEQILKSRYGGRDLFVVQNAQALFRSAQNLTRTATLLITGIAAVSLLVGGIGIMNIMLVSVTERRTEIGIRSTVGASKPDIRNQFLVETIFVTVSGGVAGISLGVFLSRFLSSIMAIPFIFSLEAVLIGFLFSVTVGIAAGLYPAVKASNLNPVDAIRG